RRWTNPPPRCSATCSGGVPRACRRGCVVPEPAEAIADGQGQRSALRGWLYLVWLSWQRQARAPQMGWIALGLLVFSTVVVALNTATGRWGMSHWRFFGRAGPTYGEWLARSEVVAQALPYPSPPARSLFSAYNAAQGAVLRESDFLVFTRGFVFLL